jgi:hypothetical protein
LADLAGKAEILEVQHALAAWPKINSEPASGIEAAGLINVNVAVRHRFAPIQESGAPFNPSLDLGGRVKEPLRLDSLVQRT